ncbi:MAG: DUF3373 domain-containing protein [Nitrospirae bacterium]|nr:DUF3373 domain-containing protein [Nitrospirota bacterium]
MKQFLVALLVLSLLLPATSFAVTQDELMQKIDALSKELMQLKQQMNEIKKEEVKKEERISKVEEKSEQSAWPSWLEIGADYRFRIDSLKGKVHDHYLLFPSAALGMTYSGTSLPVFVGGTPNNMVPAHDVKNDALLLNRFALNLKANPLEDISVKARLLMYKVWGHETMTPVQGSFSADRAMGPFDGTMGHVPQDNTLRVDYAYATWSNIADAPVWASIGRRPSTGGPPMYLKQNTERVSTTAGVQGLLVDYAFDGLTIGVAPDISGLPGAFAKFCYGKGFDSGFRTSLPGAASLHDVNFAGIAVTPASTDNFLVELQANRGFSIFDNMPDAGVRTNLGDIDWFGGIVMGKMNNFGPGNLNLFVSAAISKTHPNTNMFTFAVDGNADGDLLDVGTFDNPGAGAGLLYDDNPMTPGVDKQSHSGSAIYVGARYDIKATRTKIGLEYNHGSKYWIGMVPAGDDMWTSKLGTRGNVYEVYLIQELFNKPIANKAKAFFRLGYQYFKFNYTGSNSWIGEPKKISDLTATAADFAAGKAQMFMPLEKAYDIYATFDVMF